MRFRVAQLAVICLAVLFSGCPETPPDDATTPPSDPEAAAGGETAAAAQPTVPARDDAMGLWQVDLNNQGVLIPAFLIRVSEGSVEILDKSDAVRPLELDSATVTEDELTATLSATPPDGANAEGEKPQAIEQVLQLRFVDGKLLGTFGLGPAGQAFAIGSATASDEVIGQPSPTASAAEYDRLLRANQGKDFGLIRDYLGTLEHDPVEFLGRIALMQLSMGRPAEPEQLKKDAEALRESASLWGSTYVRDASLQSLVTFAAREEIPVEAAREQYAKTEETVGDDSNKDTTAILQMAKALIDIRDPEVDPEEIGRVVEELRRTLPPTDMLFELRKRDAVNRDDIEGELRALTEATVTPNGSGNLVRVGELYEQTRGSMEGVDDYVEKIYRDAITWFVRDADPIETKGPVLAEMFTSQSNQMAVAASVALSAAEMTVPKLIALQYHVDPPNVDPLTSPVGRTRYQSYGLRGTPALFLNGFAIGGIAGSFEMAPSAYEQIETSLPLLPNDAPVVDIELSASREGDKLTIKASAEGLPDGDVRLLAAIATEEIFLHGENGIPFHNMVVRDMPSGPDGIPAEDGRVELDVTMDLIESRNQFIAEMRASLDEVPDTIRQTIYDYGDLVVVAFVQDVQSKQTYGVATAKVPDPRRETDGGAAASGSGEEVTEGQKGPAEDSKPAGDDAETEKGDGETSADDAAEAGSIEEVPAEGDN